LYIITILPSPAIAPSTKFYLPSDAPNFCGFLMRGPASKARAFHGWKKRSATPPICRSFHDFVGFFCLSKNRKCMEMHPIFTKILWYGFNMHDLLVAKKNSAHINFKFNKQEQNVKSEISIT